MISCFDRLHSIRYISHRGFTSLAPENSVPSFEYAGSLSQWAIETDVRSTRDGVLVCSHDPDISRMFGEAGCIEQMTWHDLSRLRIQKGNRLNCFSDEQLHLPLFSEYLAICRLYGCVPFIELKTPETDKVLRAVHDAGFDDAEAVISAVPEEWLLEIRRHTTKMFIHWIFADEEKLGAFSDAGYAGVSLNIPDPFSCPQEKIDRIHSMGLKVCLRAGDSIAAVRRMSDLGLDYIPTNHMHLPFRHTGKEITV